jgi:arsenate reductase
MTKVLVLCTGNSCRSQMAEGFLASFDPALEVYSAGTFPALRVHPLAVEVMREEGIDIGNHVPKNVNQFTGLPFDYAITVCDDAKEACPVFTGTVRHRIHLPFEDPSHSLGPAEKLIPEFRRVRDEIKGSLLRLYNDRIKHQK